MGFLAAVLAKILEWLLTLGGKALFNYINEFVDKRKQEKIDRDNAKKHAKNIKQNAEKKKRGKSGSKLINGEE